jgi:hypothetical protein
VGKTPAFQFFPGDWTRDLDDQDLQVEGAWIRICCRLWWSETRGQATKPLREWARILRKTERKTKEILQILIEKGIASGSVLDNQNVTIISRRIVKDARISQIRREAGKMGGNPGLNKIRENLLNQTINQKCQSSSSSSTSVINNTTAEKKKSSSRKKEMEPFVLPEWIPKEAWDGFVEMRKEIRKPLTGRALTLAINALLDLKNKGNDPGKVLDQSTYCKWQGLFEIKGNGSRPPTPTKRMLRPSDVPDPDEEARRICEKMGGV